FPLYFNRIGICIFSDCDSNTYTRERAVEMGTDIPPCKPAHRALCAVDIDWSCSSLKTPRTTRRLQGWGVAPEVLVRRPGSCPQRETYVGSKTRCLRRSM